MILGLANSLFRMFRENSDVIPVSRLKKQGVRSVTVLDWDKIEDLIESAVEEALRRKGLDLSPEALESVNQEAREAFAQLMDQRDSFRETAENLAAQKNELEDNLNQVRDELARASTDLNKERGHQVTVDQIAVGQEGMEAFARQLQEGLKDMLGDGEALDGDSPTALADSVSALARKLLDKQRHQSLLEAKQEHDRKIELLERRVSKLKHTLDDTEGLVERLRNTTKGDEGIASVYSEVQGIDENEANVDDKKGLLAEIFKANMELRDVIAQEGKGE